MAIELTNEEKMGVITSHQRSMMYNRYNIELNLIEENAKNAPDTDAVQKMQNQLDEINRQINLLDQETAKITTSN
jgi:hypothetical protein